MLRFWKCLLPKDAPKPQTNCPALESTEGVDVLMRTSYSYLNKQCCCQAQTRNTFSWHLQQGCITQMVRKAEPASNLKRRKKSKTLMRHKWVLPRFSSSVNCWRHLACLPLDGTTILASVNSRPPLSSHQTAEEQAIQPINKTARAIFSWESKREVNSIDNWTTTGTFLCPEKQQQQL